MHIIFILLLGFLGSAQSEAQEVGTPSVGATISGKTIHAATGKPIEGVHVVLYSMDTSGDPSHSEIESDGEGSFLFENISSSPSVSYLLGARYKGIPFPGARVSFESGKRDAYVEITVSDTRPDPSGLGTEEITFRFDWQGRQLIVAQEIRLINPHSETLFIDEDDRETTPSLFQVPLPPNAQTLSFPFGVDPEGVQRGVDHLRYYGPIYPGDQIFRFSFVVREKEGEIKLGLPLVASARVITILNPEKGPELKTSLISSEVLERDGRSYEVYRFKPRSENTIQLDFSLPNAVPQPDRVHVKTGRWIVERDPVITSFNEEYKIQVSGNESVYEPSGGALVKVDLPEKAQNIRFLSEGTETELRADVDGGLALDGPLHPGETVLSLQYEIPTEGNSSRVVREIFSAIETLEVFVVDDGQTHAYSPQLHRRRPVKTANRNYISLESFSVKSGQVVELHMTSLKIPEGIPKGLFFTVLLSGTLGIIFLMSSPLLTGKATLPSLTESAIEREQIALLASLRDLEHDFETGKISSDDHRQLRDALRYRTSQTYAEPSIGHDEKPSQVCGRCRNIPPNEALFCPQCGAQLIT